MNYVITKLTNRQKTILVKDLFIDEESNRQWSLKTTQDQKRHYWRIRGYAYIVKDQEATRAKDINFRVNLSAEDAVLGLDNKKSYDKAIAYFVAALKNNQVKYEVKSNGSWNNNGQKIDYEGWLELKVLSGTSREAKKVSILTGKVLEEKVPVEDTDTINWG